MLHAECEKRLKQSLVENLSHIKVDNDIYLNFNSTMGLLSADEILPKTGKLRNRLQKYIGETPIFDFVFENLSRDLYENGTHNPDATGIPLQSIPKYGDLEVVASRLVDEFESLPWSYIVSFELPSNLGKPIGNAINTYTLSPPLRIVTPNDTFGSTYPLHSGIKQQDDWLFGILGISSLGLNALLSYSQPRQWNRETTYIQIEMEGFIGRTFKTTPLNEVISTIKSFIGLSLAKRLVKIKEGQVASSFAAQPKSHLIVHRKLGEEWHIWSTHEFPSDLSAFLDKLEIDDLEGSVGVLSKWIQSRLPIISTAFLNPDKAERLLLASQWLLDGYVGSNELLSFVQTTVAMEIMLGGESKLDIIGIGELLRNRCAYLIGKSHSQRKEILKDFENIYAVRSKIVHRGKSQLTTSERFLFSKLQWMCMRVISEELTLIGKDKENTT